MHVADALDARIRQTGSIACVGLDPRPDLLPPELVRRHRDRCAGGECTPAEAVATAFVEANQRVIDAVADRCAAVKPQAACYEAYGLAGWAALEATVRHAAAAGIPVILDAKRGDIGSTATHYGQMAFGGAPDLDGDPCPGMGADWLTVNGYLGRDGVDPVLESGGGRRGVFVLVKTSNPGSGELQDVGAGEGTTVADRMAERVAAWGAEHLGASGLSAVGAVVGATYPDHARALRERMPDTVFLVPGYGAQGASAADAVAGMRPDGRGVLVSSSRGITGAWQALGSDDIGAAAGQALDAMNADLDSAR
ncbi:MAG TPA: orotidine-5'-phosphate decarboxylase [Acidimicrobiales bacterium]|nr:orotidine-5'-phosphate decarboxylase [Acidimicrobiales bacterium]